MNGFKWLWAAFGIVATVALIISFFVPGADKITQIYFLVQAVLCAFFVGLISESPI